MHLTDLVVKNLPAPVKGQKDYRDDALPGFSVRVSQGGSRVFYLIHGRSRTRTKIGVYPAISLSQARQKAKELLAEQTLGRDKPKTIRFDEALRQFLDSYTGRKKRTEQDMRSTLNRYFLPPLRKERVGDITTGRIAKIIGRLWSKPTTCRHALAAAKMFFSWCVEQHYLATSPCERLRAPPKPRPRERVLDSHELREVLLVARATPYPFGPIVLLLILTGQRRSEIGSLRWEHLNGDLVRLPPDLTKNNREHTFPLGKWGQEVVGAIPRRNITNFLFPSWSKRSTGRYTDLDPLDKPFSNWSNPKEDFDRRCLLEPWTLHDLRRTFSTNMAAMGVRQEVTEKMLNHVSGGAVSQIARVYNRHTYLPEMREAANLWETHLSRLINSR